MTAFENAPYFGDHNFMPSAADWATVAQKDAAFYNAGLAKLQHAALFTIPLVVASTVNGATVVGAAETARFPFKVVGVEFSCESSAGSAATARLEKAESSAPTTFATMMESNRDIHTGVGYGQEGEITDTKVDFDVGDRVRLSVTATGGIVVGSRALVYAYRL